jgi:hypothetical protein
MQESFRGTVATQSNPTDDDIPVEIDFSAGIRGKFAKVDAMLEIPVYLDADVRAYLTTRAKTRGIDIDQLVHELLKNDIELLETARSED